MNPVTFIRDKIVVKYQFEPYFIVVLWLFFFFFWLPSSSEATYYIGIFFIALMPFVLPFLLIRLAWDSWFEYQWEKKYNEYDYCVLEIRLPDEIQQSPYATELMLRGFYQTGFNNPSDYYFGDTYAWFSFEMVSDEGQVRFYVWGRRQYKTLMENQIYAHYPSVQVVEVPDYTLKVPYDPAIMTVGGIEQRLQKPDPYPILTYVEIGLDKQDMKEEYKHDPIASLIEFLGSVKEGEHMWVQFIIRGHSELSWCPWIEDGKGHEKIQITEWTEKEIEKITDKVTEKKSGKGGKEKDIINFNALTQGDRDSIEAMQRKLNKQLYDVGIRGLFIADKKKAVTSPRVGLASAFRSFEHGSEGRGLNGLKPVFWIGPFNYKWQDILDIRKSMLQRRFYDAYVHRQFFFPPHRHRWIVLNSEELATLFHFPGTVVHTPTLQRMPSKRAEAPANLPI